VFKNLIHLSYKNNIIVFRIMKVMAMFFVIFERVKFCDVSVCNNGMYCVVRSLYLYVCFVCLAGSHLCVWKAH